MAILKTYTRKTKTDHILPINSKKQLEEDRIVLLFKPKKQQHLKLRKKKKEKKSDLVFGWYWKLKAKLKEKTYFKFLVNFFKFC